VIRPTKNPLTPNSLAADGMQGAGAKAQGPCGTEDSAEAARARILARSSLQAAQGHLDRCAALTDRPAPGMVEAADHVDLALQGLAVADLAYAVKSASGGEA
jgi:hypothetical protein